MGIYDVVVNAEIEFLVGTSKATTDKQFANIPLKIVIVDPCLTATLGDFNVVDMSAEINLGLDTQDMNS